ncbi:MAG: hypothetical protein F6K47_23370 [Symploca sp. SIO2E6]|nr:hypothetical protein [Symploca sp. SIO2E6]
MGRWGGQGRLRETREIFTRHQFPNNKQQTTKDKQQTTNNKQQRTNNKQQRTNNKGQTTNNKQQRTNNKQQTTNYESFLIKDSSKTHDNLPVWIEKHTMPA